MNCLLDQKYMKNITWPNLECGFAYDAMDAVVDAVEAVEAVVAVDAVEAKQKWFMFSFI